jgi:uncharacterized membrane protein YbjE (DUF340 family)
MIEAQSNTESLSAIAAIISAATALIALLISPLLSLYVAKKQISVSTISEERKEWIRSLRHNVAKFIAVISSIMIEQVWMESLELPSIKTKMDELYFLKANIGLLLNNNVESQSKLNRLLNETLVSVRTYAKQPTDAVRKDLLDKLNLIRDEAHLIIGTEWKLLGK